MALYATLFCSSKKRGSIDMTVGAVHVVTNLTHPGVERQPYAWVTQPISWADVIAIVPHFAARDQFKKDYFEAMGPDDPNFEILFVGTNPYLGAKVGRLEFTI